jgi:hypothetical protein
LRSVRKEGKKKNDRPRPERGEKVSHCSSSLSFTVSLLAERCGKSGILEDKNISKQVDDHFCKSERLPEVAGADHPRGDVKSVLLFPSWKVE